MQLKVSEIEDVLGAEIIGEKNLEISHFVLDSRKYIPSNGVCFFAIRGEGNDGHDYISKLISKGVQCFVVESIPESVSVENLCFIKVENTIFALQKLAAWVRSAYKNTLIGITGSNGKTILKEWIFQTLGNEKKVFRSPQSYNSQIGVPLSIFLIENQADLVILEAGISKTGEMARLERMIKPDIGIITNIGEAHQENFDSLEEKIQEKLMLFKTAKKIIYCADHEKIKNALKTWKNQKICWGKDSEADYQLSCAREASGIEMQINGKAELSLLLKFTDQASVENLSHLIILLLELGYSKDFIQNRIDKLENVGMRMEMLKGINNATLINDAYNSDLNSLENAIDFLFQQNQHSQKTLILSDILQSGKSFDQIFEKISGLLKFRVPENRIAIGEQFYENRDKLKAWSVFKDTDSFLERISEFDFSNHAILLKGSRKFAFEKISRYLQEKTHRTVLEIDLHALLENYRFYRSLLKSGTKVMAMVKAFSYGSGGFEVASALEYNNVDYLAVAYVDEGVQLRIKGIQLPIMVMSPEHHDFEALIKYNLEPEIYSRRIFNEFNLYLKKNAISNWPVHIKIDTGMHRLGFEEKDLEFLSCEISGSYFHVVSIFSHLSVADMPEFDDFTSNQIDIFNHICEKLQDSVPYGFLRHILNSNGIERFPEASFEMVRLGIGLYGLSEKYRENVKEVSIFKTRISQIKELKKGDTVGYGRLGKIEKNTKIATLPVGYADGLPRSLGNGKGKFLLKNNIVRVIGNICMDMTMIDLNGIDASEGDEVIIFGQGLSVNTIAQEAGTISYEILTNISQRVKRVYYQE